MKPFVKVALGAVALATAAMGAIAPANAERIVTTTTHVVSPDRPVVVVRQHTFVRHSFVRHEWLRHERHMMMRQAMVVRR